MSGRWHYSHDGVTRGPFSEAELRDHAARKLLSETDLVWPEGSSAKDAVPAGAALDFARMPPPTPSMPDWLGDVAADQSTGPAAVPDASGEVPEWLEDMRLWVGLEHFARAREAAQAAETPKGSGPLPDWLEGWLAPIKPVEPVREPLRPPAALPAVPVAVPPVAEAAPVIPVAVPVAVPSAPVPIPVAAPISASQARATDSVAESIRLESGFDVETGAILDRQKFENWKRQRARHAAAGPATVTNTSLFEVFRKARSAIEAWVDDEKNRACMMEMGPEQIKRLPQIERILAEYADYGKDMRAKLLHHLEFMVENRRKYYAATQAMR